MAEDSGGRGNDLGTSYYRSRDPIKNFKIKVHLKRVTGISLVPTAFGVEQQAGPSHEGLELRPMGSRRSIKSQTRPEDDETYTFTWQQKLFSQREVDLFRDRENCSRPVEEKYHREITELYNNGDGRPTTRLFSYVDHDTFASIEEQTMVTTSFNEKPTFLTEKMQNVRRRKQIDRRRDGGLGTFQPKINPVIEAPSEEHKRSAHVIDTPVQTMYIMADLSAVEDDPMLLDEYILCTIKYNTHGVLSVTPDFNRHRPPYTIVTESTQRDTFEYMLELASHPMAQRDQDRETKMFRELYQRHSEYIGAMVGQDFEQVAFGVLRLMVYGEIESAKNYQYDNLYVHFFVEIPKHWSADKSQQLSGVTQTCSTKEIDRENIAYFSFPFDFELFYKHDEVGGGDGDMNESQLPQWPQIFLEVLSIDSWHRYRTEGYGYLTIPSSPGIHTIDVQTWRPCGRHFNDNLRRFFIGGSPELEDPTYVAIPPTHEGAVMSRFGFRTEATGSIRVKLNLLQQSQIFMDQAFSKHKVGTLLDRLGGLTMQTSVQNVLELFQRARKRMQAAKDTLSSI